MAGSTKRSQSVSGHCTICLLVHVSVALFSVCGTVSVCLWVSCSSAPNQCTLTHSLTHSSIGTFRQWRWIPSVNSSFDIISSLIFCSYCCLLSLSIVVLVVMMKQHQQYSIHYCDLVSSVSVCLCQCIVLPIYCCCCCCCNLPIQQNSRRPVPQQANTLACLLPSGARVAVSSSRVKSGGKSTTL